MSGRELITEIRSAAKTPRTPPRQHSVIDLLFALLAMAAVGCLGYFGFTAFLRSQQIQPDPPAAAVAPDRPAPSDVAWTEADDQQCRAAARAASAVPVPAEMGLSNRAVTEGFAAFATALDCRLTHKTRRFCDPTEKAALVAMINDYLGRLDLITAGLAAQGAPMAVAGAIFGGEAAAGSGIYDMQRDHTIAFMTQFYSRVSASLQNLARDGIASPADFAGPLGFGISDPIKKMFADVEATRHLCA